MALTDEIKAAQIKAGENVVIDNLIKKRLLEPEEKPPAQSCNNTSKGVVKGVIANTLINMSQFQNGCIVLVSHKHPRDSMLKALEELNKLSTKIIQRINKGGNFNDPEVREELVDVQMHILLLETMFPDADLRNLCKEKVEKMLNGDDFKMYLDRHFKGESIN